MTSKAEKDAAKAAEKAAAQPGVQGQGAAMQAEKYTPNFDWAVNPVKLNRAKAFVRATAQELKGKEHEAAVKERYIATKGLLVADEQTKLPKGKTRGKVQNLAENDGSDD